MVGRDDVDVVFIWTALTVTVITAVRLFDLLLIFLPELLRTFEHFLTVLVEGVALGDLV